MARLHAVRRLLSVALLGVPAAACGSESPGSPSDGGRLAVSPSRLVMGLGTSRQLTVTVFDGADDPVDGAAVEYTSSDPSLATVTGEGLVRYIGPGEAEITVASGDLTAVVAYTGMRSGHPLGTTITSARLTGDQTGGGPFAAAVDADGQVLISQTNTGRLAVSPYPITTGFASRMLDGTPTSIVLLGDGAALVTPTGADNDHATVIDLESDEIALDVPLGVAAFSAVTTPDSQTVYLGTNDGRVLLFDVASSSVSGSIDLGIALARANHLALDPTGTRLYASSFTTGTVSEIDLEAGSVSRTFVVGGEPQGLAVSPDGDLLYVADESGPGDFDVYDLDSAILVTSLPSGAVSSTGGPFALALSPDGTVIYAGVITGDSLGLIQVIDAATHTIQRTITSCGGIPRRIAFGFSGGLAVVADETGCANFVE